MTKNLRKLARDPQREASQHKTMGWQLARCCWYVDLGTQSAAGADGIKLERQIAFGWEVYGSPTVASVPLNARVFKIYPLSFSDKAGLRTDIEAWRGKPFGEDEIRYFSPKSVLGSWCLLNIIAQPTKKDESCRIGGIASALNTKKRGGLPPGKSRLSIFLIEAPDLETMRDLPKHIQEKIRASEEWKRWKQAISITNDYCDDSDYDEYYKRSADGNYIYFRREYSNGQSLYWFVEEESYPLVSGSPTSRRAYTAVKSAEKFNSSVKRRIDEEMLSYFTSAKNTR